MPNLHWNCPSEWVSDEVPSREEIYKKKRKEKEMKKKEKGQQRNIHNEKVFEIKKFDGKWTRQGIFRKSPRYFFFEKNIKETKRKTKKEKKKKKMKVQFLKWWELPNFTWNCPTERVETQISKKEKRVKKIKSEKNENIYNCKIFGRSPISVGIVPVKKIKSFLQ